MYTKIVMIVVSSQTTAEAGVSTSCIPSLKNIVEERVYSHLVYVSLRRGVLLETMNALHRSDMDFLFASNNRVDKQRCRQTKKMPQKQVTWKLLQHQLCLSLPVYQFELLCI